MNRILTLFIILLGACGMSDEESILLAKKEYERKANLLRREYANNCRKDALAIAEAKADSIIRSMQINPLNDTLYRPTVPLKPEYIPIDSSIINSKRTVKPIIDSSSIKR